MALKMANTLQAKGARLTLFLDLEGVRLADSRRPDILSWGASQDTINTMYNKFIDAGGKVVLCPHCAEHEGLKAGDLRKGAALGSTDQLATMILEADKILDY